ncbi:bile acid:sodium symporter family protein [Aestuariispira insulae]|uniref:BASS family bile acid:Na+ symporter n=1 Tax=Aestuariispira insulae TaxID=1461337 RepID=A0A3D9HX39_9PROT|nr:bile acid:sodium symporter family protein [Aestuariispira insulae]RED53466.1 BASS family bile acid:Na+ symporter [Aestuariispira insulae]
MGIVTDVVLPLVLAFMMFTLGLGLTFPDFARLATRPKDMLVGLLFQIVLLPAVGFALVSLWPLAPEIAMGVMLIAVAPGGVTSNYLTALARGDVALSVSLTAVASLLCIVTIPLVLAFSHEWILGEAMSGEVTLAGTAIKIFAIVTAPVLLGMLVRRLAERFALKAEPIARTVSTIFFVLVLAGAVFQQRDNVVAYFAEAGGVTLALNLTMMLLAFLGAKMLGSGMAQRISICVECGLQNGTLAIAVGVLLYGGGAYVIPAAIYSLIMFASAMIFLGISRKKLAPQAV